LPSFSNNKDDELSVYSVHAIPLWAAFICLQIPQVVYDWASGACIPKKCLDYFFSHDTNVCNFATGTLIYLNVRFTCRALIGLKGLKGFF